MTGRAFAEPTFALGDQILAGASNVLVMFIVARSAPTETLGQFVVAWAALLFLLTLMRSSVATHVSLEAEDHTSVDKEASHALGLICALSPVTVLFVLGVTFIASRGFSMAVVLVAIFTPVVLFQDLERYRAFALGRVQLVFVADALWFVTVVFALSLTVLRPMPAEGPVLMWGLGGFASALLLLVVKGVPPRFRAARQWLIATKEAKSLYTATAVVGAGAVLGASLVVGRVGGLDVLAAYTGASQLLVPVNSLLATLGVWLLPRAMKHAERSRVNLFMRAACVVSGLCAVWSCVLLLLPTQFGEALLGDTWPSAREALPLVCLQFTVGVFAVVGGTALVSLRAFRDSLKLSIVSGGGRVLSALAMTVLVGTASAVAVGEACVLVIIGCLTWWTITKLIRRGPIQLPI